MTLGERLRTLRGNDSQATFGAKVGASQPTIRNYENNERFPDSEFIKSVCNFFTVSADWLLFGKGEPGGIEVEINKMSDTADKVKTQHVEIINTEKSNFPRGGDFEEIRALEKELRTALRDNADLHRQLADLRVEREQLLAENGRFKQWVQQLEMELDDYRTGKARLVLPVATDKNSKEFTVEEPSTSYQYKRGTPPLQEPTPPYQK